jgi:hypothetical protein
MANGKVKEKFFANIQSKNQKDGRKVIELSRDVREKFEVGTHVKVIIEAV